MMINSAFGMMVAIQYLKQKGSITNKEYKSLFNITDRTALRDLDDLVSKKLIQKTGEKKGIRYKPYDVGYQHTDNRYTLMVFHRRKMQEIIAWMVAKRNC